MSLHVALLLEWDRGWLGGVDYLRNLALSLAALEPAERGDLALTLVHEGPLDPGVRADFAPHVARFLDRKVATPRRSLARRLAWGFQRHLRGQADPRLAGLLRALDVDFAYPFPGKRLGRAVGFRAAAWIPDFQHRHLPQFFPSEDLARREAWFRGVAEAAERVVLSSEAAAEDFRRFHPAHAAKARVLRFAAPPDPAWTRGDPRAVQERYHLPERFLLCSNQLWQHKNHLLVLEALERLAAEGRSAHVVFTGGMHDYRRPEFLDEVLQAVARRGVGGRVSFLGLLPRADQVQLLRRAQAVLQPSLFERWSTVVELARALGRPLVLSDLPVHREQCPDGAFFERGSAASLATRLGEAATLPPGPDLAAERAAGTAALERCRTFARGFLALARAGA